MNPNGMVERHSMAWWNCTQWHGGTALNGMVERQNSVQKREDRTHGSEGDEAGVPEPQDEADVADDLGAPMSLPSAACNPSVFGRKLQYRPVRKWPSEMNVIGHTPIRFKRSKGVQPNGILECKTLSKTAHCAGSPWCR
jgi:hypothetical protein